MSFACRKAYPSFFVFFCDDDYDTDISGPVVEIEMVYKTDEPSGDTAIN